MFCLLRNCSALKRAITAILVFTITLSPTSLLLNADELALPPDDVVAPTVSHIPTGKSISNADSHVITATVKDDVGVQSVVLYYRISGAMTYKSVMMHRNLNSDTYSAILGAEELKPPGIEYYIKAKDLTGNSLLRGFSISPLKIVVTEAEGRSEKVAVSDRTQNDGEQAKVRTFKVTDDSENSIWGNKWLWIGLGAVAIGALAGGGGGGGSDNEASTGSIKGDVPIPQ